MFIDDRGVDGRIRMNSVVYRARRSSHIRPNAVKLIVERLMVKMGNYRKHTAKTTQDLSKSQKCDSSVGKSITRSQLSQQVSSY